MADSRWPQSLQDRAYSLSIDAAEASIRDNVALLVLAAGTPLDTFERTNPAIVRAIAERAVVGVLDYLETGHV